MDNEKEDVSLKKEYCIVNIKCLSETRMFVFLTEMREFTVDFDKADIFDYTTARHLYDLNKDDYAMVYLEFVYKHVVKTVPLTMTAIIDTGLESKYKTLEMQKEIKRQRDFENFVKG